MMDFDPVDARWGRLRADCRVFAPRNHDEMRDAALDCGFSAREAAEIGDAFGGRSLPADPPRSRVEPEGELLRVLKMFDLGQD